MIEPTVLSIIFMAHILPFNILVAPKLAAKGTVSKKNGINEDDRLGFDVFSGAKKVYPRTDTS